MINPKNEDTKLVVEDEFAAYLEEAQHDPSFRASYEDASDVHRILDTLVELRKRLGLSQTAVAERMGVRQPTVSGFETEGSDPRLSTLQRYARAVSGRLRLRVDVPSSCDWIVNPSAVYATRGWLVERTAIENPKTVERTTLPSEWVLPATGWSEHVTSKVDGTLRVERRTVA